MRFDPAGDGAGQHPVRNPYRRPVKLARVGRPIAPAMPPLPDTDEGRLAARIREMRKERGLSQAELAERVTTAGVQPAWHQTTAAKVERALRDLRYPELLAVAEALEVELLDLLALRPTDAVTTAVSEVQRLEQERRLVQERLDFVTEDLQDLQQQERGLKARLTELTAELAKARRALSEARSRG